MSKPLDNDSIDDVAEYRNTIMASMMESPELVKLLSGDLQELEETGYAISLKWKNLIPQQYLPDTVKTQEAFIFFDIDTSNANSNEKRDTYKSAFIYFWIVVHKGINRRDDGLLNDKIVFELKKLFKNQSSLGISKAHEIYNRIFNTGSTDFTGRVLGIRITDWDESVKKNAKNRI